MISTPLFNWQIIATITLPSDFDSPSTFRLTENMLKPEAWINLFMRMFCNNKKNLIYVINVNEKHNKMLQSQWVCHAVHLWFLNGIYSSFCPFDLSFNFIKAKRLQWSNRLLLFGVLTDLFIAITSTSQWTNQTVVSAVKLEQLPCYST